MLNGIIEKPYFSDSLLQNPTKVGSEGVIFPSQYPFKEGWSAGHQLIAQFAFKVEFRDVLRRTCEAAVRTSVVSDQEHSIFLARMFGYFSRGDPTDRRLALQLFKRHALKIRAIAVAFTEAEADWGEVFLKFGERELAEKCFLSARPSTPGRALFVATGLQQLGRIDESLLAAQSWCNSHPDDTLVRTFYLGMVEHSRDPELVKQAITQTAGWLAAHLDDIHVRTFYLGLVERSRDPELVKQTITQTAGWLAAHPDDIHVRTFYLGLVERSGDPELVKQTITQTAGWLAAHPDDIHVRTFYLGRVIK